MIILLLLLLASCPSSIAHPNPWGDEDRDRFNHQASKNSSGFAFRIGVNYGRIADNLLPPSQVVQLLLSDTTMHRVKIFDTEASVLDAFSRSNISMVVAAPNYLVPDLASGIAKATAWANASIAPFASIITHIAVGNEALAQNDETLKNALAPAIANVHAALTNLGLSDSDSVRGIKVSTPHSLGVLAASSPPSNGSFAEPGRMRPLLEHLNRTNAPLMVNIYPYFAYSGSSGNIPLDFVLFRKNAGRVDPATGLNYTSLFAAQLDAVRFAMRSLGFDRVPVMVSETGWPSRGDASEAGASFENAAEYNKGLAKLVNSGVGTPLRPEEPIDAFIFALFNENQKPGPASERNFGLFEPSGAPVYNSGTILRKNFRTKIRHHKVFQSASQNTANQWCVAKPGADENALDKGMSFACIEAGVDCSPIRAAGACEVPQNAFSHASFVYNSYFQKMGRNPWNCYFENTAILTISDPSYGSCRYVSPMR